MTPITINDIWLLLAIIIGGNGEEASYKEIVGTGDAINHAIFRHDQFENGLYRLTKNNLIIKTPGGYTPTHSAISDYEQAKSGTKSWFGAWDNLKVKYNAIQDTKAFNINSFSGYSKIEVAAAIESYQTDMRELSLQLVQDRYGISREEAEERFKNTMEWHQELWKEQN